MSAYQDFENYFAGINDLCCTLNLLNWDSNTQMPGGGASTRSFQIATLASIAQQKLASDETLKRIEAAEKEIAGEPPDGYRSRALSQARDAYMTSIRIPLDLVTRINELKVSAQQAWIQARNEKNYSIFEPYLKKIVEMNQRMADAIGYTDVPYDALLDRYEPGITLSLLRSLFKDLKAGLDPILDLAKSSSPPHTDFLFRDYPEDLQRKFGMEIVRKFGYDFQRGRLDIAVHPFEVSFTRQDVRITTRYKRNFLPAAIFGMFHECG
ncbi:MAG: carboxypeptidase M32, partial [Anaerolineales bacterium]